MTENQQPTMTRRDFLVAAVATTTATAGVSFLDHYSFGRANHVDSLASGEVERLSSEGLEQFIPTYALLCKSVSQYQACVFPELYNVLNKVADGQKESLNERQQQIYNTLTSSEWGIMVDCAQEDAAGHVESLTVHSNDKNNADSEGIRPLLMKFSQTLPLLALLLPQDIHVQENGGLAGEDFVHLASPKESEEIAWAVAYHESKHFIEKSWNWEKIAPYIDKDEFVEYIQQYVFTNSALLEQWLNFDPLQAATFRNGMPLISYDERTEKYLKENEVMSRYLDQAEEGDADIEQRVNEIVHEAGNRLKKNLYEIGDGHDKQLDNYLIWLAVFNIAHYLVGPVQKPGGGLAQSDSILPHTSLEAANIWIQNSTFHTFAAPEIAALYKEPSDFYQLLDIDEKSIGSPQHKNYLEAGMRFYGDVDILTEDGEFVDTAHVYEVDRLENEVVLYIEYPISIEASFRQDDPSMTGLIVRAPSDISFETLKLRVLPSTKERENERSRPNAFGLFVAAFIESDDSKETALPLEEVKQLQEYPFDYLFGEPHINISANKVFCLEEDPDSGDLKINQKHVFFPSDSSLGIFYYTFPIPIGLDRKTLFEEDNVKTLLFESRVVKLISSQSYLLLDIKNDDSDRVHQLISNGHIMDDFEIVDFNISDSSFTVRPNGIVREELKTSNVKIRVSSGIEEIERAKDSHMMSLFPMHIGSSLMHFVLVFGGVDGREYIDRHFNIESIELVDQ